MLRFDNDYTQGACQEVLDALVRTNWEQTGGYGKDEYCRQAEERIRSLCQAPEARVHFLTGGTQTNLTLIAAALRPHQGVLCADSGHIQTHETGAVEATGHRVMALATPDGKLRASQLEEVVRAHAEDTNREHCVQPGMVYLSYPTENGTLYEKQELEAISALCRREGLLLYLDGARLGYGLAAARDGMDLPNLARLCDAFYIGGTKQGALFGEALVVPDPALLPELRYHMKQRGAMLAKGRLLGVQFLALLEDGAYFRLSRKAVDQAHALAQGLQAAGVELLYPQQTNQLFPILTRAQADRLAQGVAFSPWSTLPGGREAIRLCTSWATTDQQMQELERLLRQAIA